uniref:Septin 4a n=1 Tax=Hippocampus comes TaxID=109280 RepID=A0A3Q3DAR5_HIPCM
GAEYVGLAELPDQVRRKTARKGFAFTLMVAGESGLGKSTLINALFLTDLYKDRKIANAQACGRWTWSACVPCTTKSTWFRCWPKPTA